MGAEFILKFRFVFKGSIVEASKKGTLNCDLWNLVKDLSDKYVNESRAVEGANSMLKYMQKLAPNIGLQLQAARLSIKKFWTLLDNDSEQDFLSRCVDFHKDAKAWSKEKSRWSTIGEAGIGDANESGCDSNGDGDHPDGDPIMDSFTVADICKVPDDPLVVARASSAIVHKMVASSFLQLKRAAKSLSGNAKGLTMPGFCASSLGGIGLQCANTEERCVNLVVMCCATWN